MRRALLALLFMGVFLTNLNGTVVLFNNNALDDRSTLINTMRNKSLDVSRSGDTDMMMQLVDELDGYLDIYNDSLSKSDIFYFMAYCYSVLGNDSMCVNYYKKTISYKESMNVVDIYYMNSLYNMAVFHYNNGGDEQALEYGLKYSFKSETFFYNTPNRILQGYMIVILVATEIMESNVFYEYSAKSISLLNDYADKIGSIDIGNLYLAIGTGYSAKNDYHNARIYYEKAERYFSQSDLSEKRVVDNYLMLLFYMGNIYEKIGMNSQLIEYYNKGLKLPVSFNSYIQVLFYNYYAIYLNSIGHTDAGEEVVYNAMQRAQKQNPDSKYYIMAMGCYASYIASYKKDFNTANEYYEKCMQYCEDHPDDYYLKESIVRRYYNTLLNVGKSYEALELVQDVLFTSLNQTYDNLFENPKIDGYSIINRVLSLFEGKYSILKQMYTETGNIEMLKYATEVNTMIVRIVEKMRISAETESDRLYIGHNYSNSLQTIISDNYTLYNKTGDMQYMLKAFEYSEKGSAASLIAAIRETNASQFHLPKEIYDLETSLRKDIYMYTSMMEESFNMGRDIDDESGYGDKLEASLYELDSLLASVEKDYPEYYYLKYNTSVVSMYEVTKIFGRKCNYVRYFSSDSSLYVFVVNRKHKELLPLPIDSSYKTLLSTYRSLISDSYSTYNAREKYSAFCDVAYELYKILIAPIEKYFVSNKLYIAPDNLLGSMPFEALLCSEEHDSDLNYRSLDYLLRKYDISYVYSATFSNEISKKKFSNRHKSIALAPTYKECYYSDSQLLHDLPNAREEASYVSKITDGDLMLGGSVKESVFKSISDRYDIIHLAMHSFMDSVHNNSSMIFACNENDGDDGRLYSSEIYTLPLNAKMVVLSSCNTGMGKNYSSEGIVSLARSFLFAGSQSVVMAMWEVEDMSGTQIVKSFYENLKRYQSKASALRKARLKYLENANQSMTPPYYWASLVIYGDIDALYFPGWWLVLGIIALLIFVAICISRRKNRGIRGRS